MQKIRVIAFRCLKCSDMLEAVCWFIMSHNMSVSALGITPPASVSLLRVTLCLYFVAARGAETRRAWQQQRGNVAATATVVLQARHEETTRLVSEYKSECIAPNFFVEGTAVLRKQKIKNYYPCFHGLGYTCIGMPFG